MRASRFITTSNAPASTSSSRLKDLLASAIGLYRHANCHVTRCFRLARYPVAGGQFKVCAKHHPDEQVRAGKVSHEHILRLHREHRDRVAP